MEKACAMQVQRIVSVGCISMPSAQPTMANCANLLRSARMLVQPPWSWTSVLLSAFLAASCVVRAARGPDESANPTG